MKNEIVYSVLVTYIDGSGKGCEVYKTYKSKEKVNRLIHLLGIIGVEKYAPDARILYVDVIENYLC